MEPVVDNKPILVTGMPRSGTTWVGRMISQVPTIRYVHEPFNITGRPCQCGVRFDYWFQYISSENESDYYKHFNHIIYPKLDRIALLNLIAEVKQTKRVRPLIKFGQSFSRKRTLLKDPLALFSAEWLANTFNMDVVVVIRHPAAIVSSYKSLNWGHSFSHFMEQPLLIEKHLAKFSNEIMDFAQNEYHIIDQVALLWKLINYVILKLQDEKPDWIFVRHMDLSHDPIGGFQEIYDQLQLPFSDREKRIIQDHSVSKGTEISTKDPYSVTRNSQQTINKWKDKLTLEEVDRVRERVEDVSQAFFRDEDW